MVLSFSSKLWAINSGREDLLKKDSIYLYNNCKLCAKHFDHSCFRNYRKNRLHETAVPTIFSHHEVIRQRLLGKSITGNTNVSHNFLYETTEYWDMENSALIYFTCITIFYLDFGPPAKHARKDRTDMCNSNPANTGHFKGMMIFKICDT